MKARTAAASALAVSALVGTVWAADHIDSPAATAEPSADITDLFAWMSQDTEHLNVVMNVTPFADQASKFSPAAQYVFHVNSSAAYGEQQTEAQIICQFDDAGLIECWGGGSYVKGDPSDPAGIVSDDGVIRVFAGLRDDPFFFEFDGFTETVKAVVAAAPGLTFDDDKCPLLDAATGQVLRTQLASGIDGAPASDFFAGANVLSLVVQIQADAVATSGPLLGVWASTHSK